MSPTVPQSPKSPTASAGTTGGRNARLAVVVPVLVAGALWAVYSRAIDAPLAFDDVNSIERNSSIARLWPLVGSDDERGAAVRRRAAAARELGLNKLSRLRYDS